MTGQPEDGDGAYRVMQAALESAGVEPGVVDYINAHGTSTPINDPTETLAVRRVFGEHANKLAMSSTKSMTGHLLGAAGGLEAGITALAVRNQMLPPTINLDAPGEGCDLDYVPHQRGGRRALRALQLVWIRRHQRSLLFKKYEKSRDALRASPVLAPTIP